MALCPAADTASAGTAYWFGTNGVSATTNWSGTAPGGYSAYSPGNNAANFNWNTKATSPSIESPFTWMGRWDRRERGTEAPGRWSLARPTVIKRC